MDTSSRAYATEALQLDTGPPPPITYEYVTDAGPLCEERCTADGECRWFYVATIRGANTRIVGASACCHRLVRFRISARPNLERVVDAHRRHIKALEVKHELADAANLEDLLGGWGAFRMQVLSLCSYLPHTVRELAERLEVAPLRVAHRNVAELRELGLLRLAPDENDGDDWRIPYRTTRRGREALDVLRARLLV